MYTLIRYISYTIRCLLPQRPHHNRGVKNTSKIAAPMRRGKATPKNILTQFVSAISQPSPSVLPFGGAMILAPKLIVAAPIRMIAGISRMPCGKMKAAKNKRVITGNGGLPGEVSGKRERQHQNNRRQHTEGEHPQRGGDQTGTHVLIQHQAHALRREETKIRRRSRKPDEALITSCSNAGGSGYSAAW